MRPVLRLSSPDISALILIADMKLEGISLEFRLKKNNTKKSSKCTGNSNPMQLKHNSITILKIF